MDLQGLKSLYIGRKAVSLEIGCHLAPLWWGLSWQTICACLILWTLWSTSLVGGRWSTLSWRRRDEKMTAIVLWWDRPISIVQVKFCIHAYCICDVQKKGMDGYFFLDQMVRIKLCLLYLLLEVCKYFHTVFLEFSWARVEWWLGKNLHVISYEHTSFVLRWFHISFPLSFSRQSKTWVMMDLLPCLWSMFLFQLPTILCTRPRQQIMDMTRSQKWHASITACCRKLGWLRRCHW